ncbi:kelch-like protein 42 isoform X2 [Antennarius striatus]|uniref:kelch-like protein 42 isoform X2 n=1 Tax=Antennarius striatus TaxID=241820 RepID=UPI0035B35C93
MYKGLKFDPVADMNTLRKSFMVVFKWIWMWMKCGIAVVWGALLTVNNWRTSQGIPDRKACKTDSEAWKSNEALRMFYLGDDADRVTVQTSTHAFHVDLGRLSECSEYFRALSQSRMREISESLIQLDHIPSSIFYNLLDFTFHNNFKVPREELGAHIQVGTYLIAETFLSKCLSVLADELTPDNCLSFLSLAQEICCPELKMTVFTYLSRNMLEMPQIIRCLSNQELEKLVHLRKQGDKHVCSLRKENLTSWKDPETEASRHVFSLKDSEDGGDWYPVTELPFRADKWCFTTVVLYNYLYIIGGYRQRIKRGWEFKMSSFRYNPCTHTWVATAPLIKHRRHFSAVACEGCIYAIGGWYLDSLVTPDSSTALYMAVECYDPWDNTWRFVSSLPLTDFQFSMSLSHDVPLVTRYGRCLYVLGSIQRTGEKLLLQYNTEEDSWSELLPSLTRTDADFPALYFLGATDKLLVIGGNNLENVVTSYCLQTHTWGQIHRTDKDAFVGQGTVEGGQVLLMPSIKHNAVVKLDLQTLTTRTLTPLPISICYESIFCLHF